MGYISFSLYNTVYKNKHFWPSGSSHSRILWFELILQHITTTKYGIFIKHIFEGFEKSSHVSRSWRTIIPERREEYIDLSFFLAFSVKFFSTSQTSGIEPKHKCKYYRYEKTEICLKDCHTYWDFKGKYQVGENLRDRVQNWSTNLF